MAYRTRLPNAYAGMRRVERRPSHRWYVETRPWQIQPMLLAPVLAGETLKSATFQSRVVTDPIKSKLLGWHKEYYFFYVKLTDLDARDTITAMMINPGVANIPGGGLSSLEEAASLKWYNYGDSVPWAKLCLKRVVEEYFRNEGEAWDTYAIDGVPLASVGYDGLQNSLVRTDTLNDLDIVVDDGDDVVTAGGINEALRQWQQLQMSGLVKMDWEDYLSTFGVKVSRDALHRPELIRQYREWQYPSNTVTQGTGAVTSAVSWSVSDRIDKDRYFKEPGFILGVSVARPKIYLQGQYGAAAGILDHLLAWLPASMHTDAMASLAEYGETQGPFAGVGETPAGPGYTVDARDLFVYGDQFLNVARGVGGGVNNMMSIPDANTVHRYASDADAAALFTTTPASHFIRQDGICNLHILGHQRDQTPGAPVPIPAG